MTGKIKYDAANSNICTTNVQKIYNLLEKRVDEESEDILFLVFLLTSYVNCIYNL